MAISQESGIHNGAGNRILRLALFAPLKPFIGVGEVPLQRLFSAFPGGFSGFSLLLLRAVLGGAMVLQGAAYLREPGAATAQWLLGLAALACGSLLLVGFLTP